MKKYLILLILIISLSITQYSLAGQFDIPGNGAYIENVSTQIDSNNDIVETINYNGYKILSILKLIIGGLLVIFIVFAGAQMIWSMGDNEEDLSKAKRSLWYAVVGLLFVNIPGTLYQAFHKKDYGTIGRKMSNNVFESKTGDGNIFFDVFGFGYTFGDQIIGFLEVIIIAIAIIVIIYEGLKLITSRGREEKVTEAKNKIVYSILALVFVGMIAAWKHFAFSGKISEATNIFGNLADVALFFAAPVAFFFLTLAGYYYITSAGDEEKVKKAKSIVINTVLATLILLASYTFLLDLANL